MQEEQSTYYHERNIESPSLTICNNIANVVQPQYSAMPIKFAYVCYVIFTYKKLIDLCFACWCYTNGKSMDPFYLTIKVIAAHILLRTYLTTSYSSKVRFYKLHHN